MTLDDMTKLAIRLQHTVSKQIADGKVAIILSLEDDRALTAALKVKYANYFKEEAFPTTLGGGKFIGVPIVVHQDVNRVAELERDLAEVRADGYTWRDLALKRGDQLAAEKALADRLEKVVADYLENGETARAIYDAHDARAAYRKARGIVMTEKEVHRCKFCGLTTPDDPSDQQPPADTCSHENPEVIVTSKSGKGVPELFSW